MIDRLAALIVDEGKWLTVSMGVASLALALLLYKRRRGEAPPRRVTVAAMSLFFGATIGTMAFGHLLAVTTKLAMGTLRGSVALLYLIGIMLAVPSWWLVLHTRAVLASEGHGRRTVTLNAWLAATLVVLGIPNLPLAVPGLFNIAYHLHARRAVGWAALGMAVVVNAFLFVGSLVFLASGQTFEQFRGM
jgi:hypothetical protein